jgi:hypothetical protein
MFASHRTTLRSSLRQLLAILNHVPAYTVPAHDLAHDRIEVLQLAHIDPPPKITAHVPVAHNLLDRTHSMLASSLDENHLAADKEHGTEDADIRASYSSSNGRGLRYAVTANLCDHPITHSKWDADLAYAGWALLSEESNPTCTTPRLLAALHVVPVHGFELDLAPPTDDIGIPTYARMPTTPLPTSTDLEAALVYSLGVHVDHTTAYLTQLATQLAPSTIYQSPQPHIRTTIANNPPPTPSTQPTPSADSTNTCGSSCWQ